MYDIAVLGGGPGGYVAALRAAQLGAAVCLVEQDELGGVCLNKGCIPTKALLASAEVYAKARRAEEFGVCLSGLGFDWGKIQARSGAVVRRLRQGLERLLRGRGVEVLRGRGELVGEGELVVHTPDGAQQTVRARAVIVATGSLPGELSQASFDGQVVLNSDHALALRELPKRLVIVGAGVVGCEFACLFSAFGVEVTLVELLPRILPMEDSRISAALAAALRKCGVRIYTGTALQGVERRAEGAVATLEEGTELLADALLVAVGRVPRSQGLGLEELGVELERGALAVDEAMRTSLPWLYAIGDVTAKTFLAHAASAQGVVAAERILNASERELNYRAIPSCIFTIPEVASIGYTEDELKERGMEYTVGQFPLGASGRAVALGEGEGFVKLLAAPDGTLLGAHIIGPHATEMIAPVALAMQAGLGAEEVADAVQAHPTMAEAVVEAAAAIFGEALHIIGPPRRG